MLERLQTISEVQEDYDPDYDEDEVTLAQEAVIFDNSEMDCILKEANSIGKEISMMNLDVERLNVQNEQLATAVGKITIVRRDFDRIARRVQQHGEAVYNRLKALGEERKRLEEKEGPNIAVSRIARVQYDNLTSAFHAAMNDYNQAEDMKKKICRVRIQRQSSIMGTKITDGQLDVLVDKGGEGWGELSDSLRSAGGQTSRWAMCEIKGRHKELVELEARMKDIHELFLQLAILVEEQGPMLNNIEFNVCRTEQYVENINVNIKRALQYKRKNPFRQCCPCLPCWAHNQTF